MTYLGYGIHLSGVEAADQIYDLAMAVVCQIMRSLCGARWTATEVYLTRRQPRNLEPYGRFFQTPLRFNAEQSSVAFPSQ